MFNTTMSLMEQSLADAIAGKLKAELERDEARHALRDLRMKLELLHASLELELRRG